MGIGDGSFNLDTKIHECLRRAAGTIRCVTMTILCVILCTVPTVGMTKPASWKQPDIHSSQVWVALSCGKGCLYQYSTTVDGPTYKFAPPSFEIDGQQISAEVQSFAPTGPPLHLNNLVTEYSFNGTFIHDRHLHLGIQIQINDGAPVIRFRYVLTSDQSRKMGMNPAGNSLTYFTVSLRGSKSRFGHGRGGLYPVSRVPPSWRPGSRNCPDCNIRVI